ncbi:MAG: HAD hydrolase-like protein [Acidobacteria bacterium]|nr:HAD hydrolase-like protein [Acidobacteriota bacterium]NIM62661.1 HAD hydrolase-like protein [Acidobacteriota bacterium]NIO59901.1 HAD hydrolase-like protein [Acidobacteriota bacterium]NIQ86075.1 HAD hydrolase-like protein [Acidobacteriota bacterium]NIT11591.1 HAD hydrolase-like protein [Acidobacteriota bacterium]
MCARLVLFDIDGTLVDCGGAGRRALVGAFEQLFRPGSVSAAMLVPFAGKTDFRIFREIAHALGIKSQRLAKKRAEFERAYELALHRELHDGEDTTQRVLPGVLTLLEKLAARDDARVGLLTGNIPLGARLKLERFDLDRFFEGGGFGDDARNRRGVARAAREDMQRRTGIDFAPDDVVVFGDTDEDVDCARHNGFRAVAVETGWAEPGSLEAAKPDALFRDLSDTDAVLETIFAE